MTRKPYIDQNLLRELINWGEAREFNLKDLEYSDLSCFNNQNKLRIDENGPQVMGE